MIFHRIVLDLCRPFFHSFLPEGVVPPAFDAAPKRQDAIGSSYAPMHSGLLGRSPGNVHQSPHP
jgi:hypothetical protein